MSDPLHERHNTGTRRSRLWRVAAMGFMVINVLGLVYAIAVGEMMHAGTHAALLFLAYVGWQIGPWRRARPTHVAIESPLDVSDSMTRIQQSVDAIAVEVERIGEGQRFISRVLTEKTKMGQAGTEPVAGKAIEAIGERMQDKNGHSQ